MSQFAIFQPLQTASRRRRFVQSPFCTNNRRENCPGETETNVPPMNVPRIGFVPTHKNGVGMKRIQTSWITSFFRRVIGDVTVGGTFVRTGLTPTTRERGGGVWQTSRADRPEAHETTRKPPGNLGPVRDSAVHPTSAGGQPTGPWDCVSDFNRPRRYRAW